MVSGSLGRGRPGLSCLLAASRFGGVVKAGLFLGRCCADWTVLGMQVQTVMKSQHPFPRAPIHVFCRLANWTAPLGCFAVERLIGRVSAVTVDVMSQAGVATIYDLLSMHIHDQLYIQSDKLMGLVDFVDLAVIPSP